MKVTRKFLEAQVARLNRMFGVSPEAYTVQADGRYKPNVGTFMLDSAYDRWALHRIVNADGGDDDVLRIGHVTMRELSQSISAFINGVEAAERRQSIYAEAPEMLRILMVTIAVEDKCDPQGLFRTVESLQARAVVERIRSRMHAV